MLAIWWASTKSAVPRERSASRRVCHASTGKQGGIVFDSQQAAYDTLRGQKAFRAGDPACSEIVFRMAATDPYVRMPPGATLDPAEQCAIAQWIAVGAKP